MSLKLLKKLTLPKYRDETGLFAVEGKKGVEELLASDLTIETIYATLESLAHFEELASAYGNTHSHTPAVVCVTEENLTRAGTFQTNNAAAAIARMPEVTKEHDVLAAAKASYVLVLDEVRDPGNLGTILRTADWFGITHIVLSETSTDPYSPKAIAASMGSFTRMHLSRLPLPDLLAKASASSIPIMGALLKGENIFEITLPKNGILIMGSESHGIEETLLPFISHPVTVPRFGKAESLNVASATAVILATLKQ